MSFDAGAFGQGVATSAANLGINAIGSVVSGLIDNAFYRRNLRLQTDAQKELIDYQNEYNSPSAQMQRLLSAGLNPHLVYGSSAPAGQSGNAAAPAGHAPDSYNSADVARAMLQMREMQQVESSINLQNASAEKARAEARYTNGMADRYNELIDVQINEANERIRKIGSEFRLNESSIQLQTAQRLLYNAEEAYRRSEIDLQTFRKQQIIAQTALFSAQKDLTRTNDYYAEVSGQMDILELEYRKLFYGEDGGKSLAANERQALENKFRLDLAKAAAVIGIEGNKVTQWIDWIMSQAGKIFGGAGTAAVGTTIANRPKPIPRVKGL